MSKKFRLGDVVIKTMGVRQIGEVIPYISLSAYTDGTYREPHSNEMKYIVYIRWSDGTKGWIHDTHIELYTPNHNKSGL